MRGRTIIWLATLALVFQGLLSAWLLPQMTGTQTPSAVAAAPVAETDWPPCHGEPPASVATAPAPAGLMPCGDCGDCPWAQACQPAAALVAEWRMLDWTLRLSLSPSPAPTIPSPLAPRPLKPPISARA